MATQQVPAVDQRRVAAEAPTVQQMMLTIRTYLIEIEWQTYGLKLKAPVTSATNKELADFLESWKQFRNEVAPTVERFALGPVNFTGL